MGLYGMSSLDKTVIVSHCKDHTTDLFEYSKNSPSISLSILQIALKKSPSIALNQLKSKQINQCKRPDPDDAGDPQTRPPHKSRRNSMKPQPHYKDQHESKEQQLTKLALGGAVKPNKAYIEPAGNAAPLPFG